MQQKHLFIARVILRHCTDFRRCIYEKPKIVLITWDHFRIDKILVKYEIIYWTQVAPINNNNLDISNLTSEFSPTGKKSCLFQTSLDPYSSNGNFWTVSSQCMWFLNFSDLHLRWSTVHWYLISISYLQNTHCY